MRDKAFGQDYKQTIVDKFGIYLSVRRVLIAVEKIKKPVACLEIGCGYYAKLLRELLPYVDSAVGIDVTISDDLKKNEKLLFIESNAEDALEKIKDKKFDLILMINVVEHLNEPLQILKKSYELLNDKGILLVNVPTWRGKFFLELAAFKLGASPKYEMDDHKMYYDKKDLWPLLVKAGFKPSNINIEYHKFGLNIFSEALKSD